MLPLLFNQEAGAPVDVTPPVVTAAPPGGVYPTAQTVVLSANEAATIRYTTNGTQPTMSSPVYAGPLAIDGLVTLRFFAVDAAGNASAVQSETYTIEYTPLAAPPSGWLSPKSPGSPGDAGSWGTHSAPAVPAPSSPAPVFALGSYLITLDGLDITSLVDSCTVEAAESSVLSTVSLSLPVGVDVDRGASLVVSWGAEQHSFLVEELSGDGPRRQVWGRAGACVLDEPHAAAGSWNSWDNPHDTAAALAATLAGDVPLAWQCPDWDLPPVWDLSGTPLAALQTLAASVGALVLSTGAGGLVVRDRWPVRPPNMAVQSPVVTVSRDTALSPVSVREESGKGWGTVTVYGYNPSADLPDLEVEESSPVSGQPVHVRMYWPRPVPPDFTSFITNGSASSLGAVTAVVENEEITIENGKGSTRYPVTSLNSYEWIGTGAGALRQVSNQDRRELCVPSPSGRGLARVTYTTSYDRWRLTGQAVSKVIFGVEVSQLGAAVKVKLASGGSIAPDLSQPLLGDQASCIAAGTAALDESRARAAVTAELPLTSTVILPGSVAQVSDLTSGVSGRGKVVRVTTTLEPAPRTTRSLEVQVCH